MGYLEVQFYENCKNELYINNGKYIEENWHRFFGDCYLALDATNLNLLKLFDIIKSIHENIKFSKKQNKTILVYNFLISRSIHGDVFHLTLVTPNNLKTIYFFIQKNTNKI